MQIIFHWFSFINDILNFLLFLVIVLIFVHKGFWYSTGDMWMHSSMVACMLNICKLYSTRSSCRCFFDSFIDDILNFFVFLPFRHCLLTDSEYSASPVSPEDGRDRLLHENTFTIDPKPSLDSPNSCPESDTQPSSGKQTISLSSLDIEMLHLRRPKLVLKYAVCQAPRVC